MRSTRTPACEKTRTWSWVSRYGHHATAMTMSPTIIRPESPAVCGTGTVPVATVLPAANGVWPAMRALWRQRRFIAFFCRRALDFRYKRALFGWFWLLVRSLFWMLPFSLVIGHVAGGDVESVPYALFVL